MTTSTAPRFTVRSSSTSPVRALLVAAFCAFIVTSFLLDVQRGASTPAPAEQAELRT
jgi:hypothetical protein